MLITDLWAQIRINAPLVPRTSPSIKQAVLVSDIKLLTNFAVFPDPDGPTQIIVFAVGCKRPLFAKLTEVT